MQFDSPALVHEESTEAYFQEIATKIIGHDYSFEGLSGRKKMVYADWIASGRLYAPIEDLLVHQFGPLVGNTHSESSHAGEAMTLAYKMAQQIIKKHVNANDQDIIITQGSGMTGAIAKLQRILGLQLPDKAKKFYSQPAEERPVIFLTHMEHHSNHTSWLETIVDLEVINQDEEGLVSLEHFDELLKKYAHRKLKIASVTACSNVTGIETPYQQIAKKIHAVDGYCFVDFACSGPYVKMDMHPKEEGAHLDAIFISPHKFLGGPGTPGIMVFNKKLYQNNVPDNPGGGTVYFTNPWNAHKYVESIEDREDGGTPPFLQGIRAALAFKLKEEMGTEAMAHREHQIVLRVMNSLEKVEGLHILAGQHKHRLGAISFTIDGIHFNLVVKLLNDHFGIQVRGGCACAGTYGHCLLNIDKPSSFKILDRIHQGEIKARPGWIRLSLHPTMSDEDIERIITSIQYVAEHKESLAKEYTYDAKKNIFVHNSGEGDLYEEHVLRGFYSDLHQSVTS